MCAYLRRKGVKCPLCPAEILQEKQKYTGVTAFFRKPVKKKLAMLQFYWYYINH